VERDREPVTTQAYVDVAGPTLVVALGMVLPPV
jgi:hypothetical protein